MRERKRDYYLIYTLCFAVLAAVHLSFFFLNGKLPMKASDGLPQDYNAFLYWGDYIRNFFRTLFVQHRFALPAYDSTIGYGADVMLTLHYHVIGDPFYLILALVPRSHLDVCFGLIGELRLYVAGLTFSMYALYHKNKRYHVLAGALVYAFSGYLLTVCFTNNMFAMPAIYFPLIVLGIDKIFNRERPYLFIWATALSALANFYFLYMLIIFAVIYAIFRYVVLVKDFTPSVILKWLGTFSLFGLISMMISCVIFLPLAIHLVFYMNRFGVEHYSSLLYPLDYYQTLLASFITTINYPDMYTYLGFSAAGILGICILFSIKGKYRDLKIATVMFAVFLCIPFFGRFFNGFAYMTNRWTWAYVMLVSYILVKVLPEIPSMTVESRIVTALIEGGYILMMLSNNVSRAEAALVSAGVLLAATLILFAASEHVKYEKLAVGALIGCVFLGIYVNMFFWLSPSVSTTITSYEGGGTVNPQVFSSGLKAAKDVEDHGVYRVDQYNAEETANTAMNNDVMSTAFYYSIYNNNLSNLFRELRLQNTSYDYKFYNLDSRSMLEALFGVKYIVVKEGEEDYLPYDYRNKLANSEDLGDVFKVYEGDVSLPLAFTSNALIDPTDYENASATERQQALLQGVYVPELKEKKTHLTALTPEYNDVSKVFSIDPGEDIELSDGLIHVKKDGASMDLIYEGEEASENYLLIDGLDYRAAKKDYGNEAGVIGAYKRLKNRYSDRIYHENASLNIYVTIGDLVKRNIFRTYKHLTYCGQHDVLYNAGYSEEPLNKITIAFGFAGDYSYDDMKVVCQPVEGLEERITALKEYSIDDLKIDGDKITGTIELPEERLLCLTLPYTSGWRAWVDGKETDVFQTDTAFLGILLDKGSHEIEFKYHTPFKLLGGILTLLGLMAFAGIVLWYRHFHPVRGSGQDF